MQIMDQCITLGLIVELAPKDKRSNWERAALQINSRDCAGVLLGTMGVRYSVRHVYMAAGLSLWNCSAGEGLWKHRKLDNYVDLSYPIWGLIGTQEFVKQLTMVCVLARAPFCRLNPESNAFR